MIFIRPAFFPFVGISLILLAPNFSAAQVLLNFPNESTTPSTQASPTTPMIPGITIGGGTSKSSILDPDDDEKPTPRSTSPLLDYSSGGYTPGYSPDRFRQGRPVMTREEIVRQRQMEAWRRNAELDNTVRKLEREARMQDGIRELLGEKDPTLPQVLRKSNEKKTEGDEKIISDNSQAAVLTKQPTATEKEPAKLLTEEELAEKEMQDRLATIQQLSDPVERQRQLESLQKQDERRKRWNEKRLEAEKGANLFLIPQLRPELLKEGKCLLFDGQTLFGWRTQKDGRYGGGRFTVQKNEIHSDPYHPGLLYTAAQYGDLTLSFEFQSERLGEVYLLLRSSPDPKDLASSCYCVVLNSSDSMKLRGSILGRQQLSHDQVKDLGTARAELVVRDRIPESQRWRKVNVHFEGSQLQVMIDNEQPISLYDTNPLGYGYIGLLVTKGQAKFRNIFWSPGSSLSLSDKIDPENHWRYKKDAVQLSLNRLLEMHLSGGPGVIETKHSYDNFILQLEYNISFTSARTGLFFRSSPREEQSGYEVSIQNLPRREDRESILGVDVGAFRGRKNARYTRAEDQKWNHLTLLAVDRQFQTWVNGIPVCEMSDQRPFSPDSKDGPFLNPGTIQLLAPDKMTNVSFRNIRITPINPRREKQRTFDDRAKSTWESLNKERRNKEKETILDK